MTDTPPSAREVIEETIGRHDHNRIPEGYGAGVDNPDASDWSVYIADFIVEALRSRGYEITRVGGDALRACSPSARPCGMCNGTRRVKAASDLLARSPRDHAEYMRQIEEGPDYPCPLCASAASAEPKAKPPTEAP